ncbi:MAG: hypothetical protein AAFR11_12430 [Pseudomonadota bacterium]
MRKRESAKLSLWARDAAGLAAVLGLVGAVALWGQAAAAAGF